MSAAALAHARFNALTFQRFNVSFPHFSLLLFAMKFFLKMLLAILVGIVIAGAFFSQT
jgi:type II secretory pathway component PulF